MFRPFWAGFPYYSLPFGVTNRRELVSINCLEIMIDQTYFVWSLYVLYVYLFSKQGVGGGDLECGILHDYIKCILVLVYLLSGQFIINP